MRFECPHCRKLEAPTDLRVEGGRARWTCPACGDKIDVTLETKAAGGEPSAEENSARSGEETEGPSPCPKCGAPRPDRPDCPRCGLIFDRWDPDRFAIPADPVLDPLWREVEEHGEDPKRHLAFVTAARSSGKLDIAAGRYSERLRQNPDDQEAMRQLTRITAAVQADGLRSERPATKGGDGSSRRRWGLVALVVLMLAILIYLLFSDRLTPSPEPDETGGSPRKGPGSYNLKEKETSSK